MRRLLAAVAAGAALGLALAAPAYAEDNDKPAPVCPTWTLRSITDTWGDPADGSKVIGPNNVQLVKPQGGGTEFATADAGIDLDAAADITVRYTLLDEASTAAGAVRLFYYEQTGADTVTTAPTGFTAATDNDGGTITVHAQAGHVGTLGVVYDASNSAGGAVKFTQLKVGDQPVSFTDKLCPSPATESPSPSASPSTTAAAAPAAQDPPAQSGGSAASLPVTGSPVQTLALVGVGGLLVGAVLWLLNRRKEKRFTA